MACQGALRRLVIVGSGAPLGRPGAHLECGRTPGEVLAGESPSRGCGGRRAGVEHNVTSRDLRPVGWAKRRPPVSSSRFPLRPTRPSGVASARAPCRRGRLDALRDSVRCSVDGGQRGSLDPSISASCYDNFAYSVALSDMLSSLGTQGDYCGPKNESIFRHGRRRSLCGLGQPLRIL